MTSLTDVLPNMMAWALSGWIANMVIGRRIQMSTSAYIAYIIVGIIGAEIGGVISMNSFGIHISVFAYFGLVGAVVGSIILLFIAGLVWPKLSTNLPTTDQKIQPPVSTKIQPKVEKKSLPRFTAKNVPSGIIFLSYRRADSADVSGRIYDRLVGAFDKVAVFKDVDSIPLGTDFKEYLDEKVSECNVLLAVIGDKWLEVSDARGKRRLEDPQDFVRIEIESALARNIPVIPLLVRGAPMPSEDELPEGLKKLAFRNGTQIRADPDFHRDMDRVIAALKGYVESKR